MAALGSGINAGLGRIDYSPIARGGEAAARGIMGAANTRAQGVMAIGQGLAQGIQTFQKKKEEKELMEQASIGIEGFLVNNPQLAQSMGAKISPDGDIDNGMIKSIVTTYGGPKAAMQAIGQMSQQLKIAGMEQQKIEMERNKIRAQIEQAGRGFGLQEQGIVLQARGLDQNASQFDRRLAQDQSQFDQTMDVTKRTADANIENTKAQTQSLTGQQMRAPEGYRWTPDGSQLEPIPGGPVDVQNRTKEEQAEEANMLQVYKLNESIANTDSVIGEILNIIGPKDDNGQTRAGILADGGSGFGVWIKWIPMTDARALGKAIETVKANIGFDRLQRMRDMSKTGGALGQVAIQELDALQNSITSLDQGADEETLRANLMKVLSSYERVRSIFSQQLEALRPTDGVRVDRVTGKRYVKGPNGEAIEIP